MPITYARPSNGHAYNNVDGQGSVIALETLRAYLKTRYEVLVDPPFDQFIHRPCPKLARLMAWHGVKTAATITAWNPESRLTDPATNAAAQAELVSAIDAAGYHHLPVFGHDPDGIWPGEESRLVLGISRSALIDFGRRFSQNAVTMATRNGKPELLLLR